MIYSVVDQSPRSVGPSSFFETRQCGEEEKKASWVGGSFRGGLTVYCVLGTVFGVHLHCELAK